MAAALALPAGAADLAAKIAAHEKVVVVESPFYTVDRIYRSMTGPSSTQPVTLEAGPAELLWITGYSAEVVGDSGDGTGLSQFMCHSNLDVDAGAYERLLGLHHSVNPRLFTLSQGQMDVEFPPGFGIPVLSDEPLSLTSQVLNLNYADCDIAVEHRTRIRYVRDRDLDFPMKALYEQAVYGLKVLSGPDGRFGEDPAHHSGHGGASCLPGANAGLTEYRDGFGRTMTGHWVVPPGREVDRTPVDAMLALPGDTTVHFIAVHLHPFAESLELHDDTAGKTVWKAQAENSEGRIGLDRVDALSSPEGLPIYREHRYELISTYDNTSGAPQDSMAVMYLYLLDPGFQKPKLPAAPAAAASP